MMPCGYYIETLKKVLTITDHRVCVQIRLVFVPISKLERLTKASIQYSIIVIKLVRPERADGVCGTTSCFSLDDRVNGKISVLGDYSLVFSLLFDHDFLPSGISSFCGESCPGIHRGWLRVVQMS